MDDYVILAADGNHVLGAGCDLNEAVGQALQNGVDFDELLNGDYEAFQRVGSVRLTCEAG